MTTPRLLRRCAAAALLLSTLHFAPRITGQQDTNPLPQNTRPLRRAMLLLRAGKTAQARKELEQPPADAEVLYQIARSYLIGFYQQPDPQRRTLALPLAMENLAAALQRNPDHIPAVRAKAVIHASAELLYYDPNLTYRMASRAARLDPNNNGFLINLSEWMSGEVCFSEHSDHRVPHDPLLGLDRSIELLDQVIHNALPYSQDESAALCPMGNSLSRRGNFAAAISYYRQALLRNLNVDQKLAAYREMGASYYRMGDYAEAGRNFYEALQVRVNPVDQWLFRVALDHLPGPPPALPKEFLFAEQEPAIDPATPPLLAFEDMAPRLGIHHLNGNGTCAWGDIDGGGDLDLIVSGSGTFLRVYRNDGDKFTDVTDKVGLSHVPSGYSLNLVDYDNDGWLDLFVSLNNWSGPMPDLLFRNDHGKLVNVSKKSRADDSSSGFVSLWGDLDDDGWLDLVVANGVLKDSSVTQIYRSNRDGTFTNVTAAAGLNEPPAWGAIGIALGDYDKDGRLDLLINGHGGAPNRLYHNDGNRHFTEVAQQAGIAQPPHNGFVCVFVDYNNDGWPDILTTSLAPSEAAVEGLRKGYAPPGARALHPHATRLIRNNGNGSFTDVTFQSKLYYPTGTMGASVADLDNGYVDLYLGTGDPQMSRLDPNRFFHNNGDGTFSDLTRYVGFARPGNKGHGVSLVDIDSDGDHAHNAFYRNLKGNGNNWLEMDLRGVKSNRFAAGAQLTMKAGALPVYREVKGSEGFGATSPYRQHFGLAQKNKIDSLEIRWPSGIRQQFTGLAVNQIIAIKEDAREWVKIK